MSLSFDSDSQLEQSTNFLKLAHPLNYTAAVKKSQVRATSISLPAVVTACGVLQQLWPPHHGYGLT